MEDHEEQDDHTKNTRTYTYITSTLIHINLLASLAPALSVNHKRITFIDYNYTGYRCILAGSKTTTRHSSAHQSGKHPRSGEL